LFFSVADEAQMWNCFLNLPLPQQRRNPLDPRWSQRNQFEDYILNQQRQQHPQRFPVRNISGIPLVHFRQVELEPDELKWRIAIPTALLENMIWWFHQVLGHTGETRLYDTIRARIHHPSLKRRIEQLLPLCDTCKRHKLSGPGFGELPMRDVPHTPWEEVHVDLLGPWKVEVNGNEIQMNALTCIDPVTNLAELVRIDSKTSAHVAQQFQNCWLSRYP
jgi:Integrase zinc binding domain